MKYSLFLLEKAVMHNSMAILLEECCIHLDTYDTLEEAKSAQKETKQKTIILQSF